jgi:GDPmannose 4,6-dehydratase
MLLVEVDPRYFRPTEVDLLIGDPAKATQKLGWAPETLGRDLAPRWCSPIWKS